MNIEQSLCIGYRLALCTVSSNIIFPFCKYMGKYCIKYCGTIFMVMNKQQRKIIRTLAMQTRKH